MRSPYKHVQTYIVKGRVVRYYRIPGSQKVRLEGEPGSVEFASSYEAASKPRTQFAHTLGGLLDRYFASVDFSAKAPRTQGDYLKHKAPIEAKWGETPLEHFDDKRIRQFLIKWHLELVAAKGARQADLTMAFMRVVLSYGVYSSAISHNHLMGFRTAYKVDRSDAIWSPEDVKAFEGSANWPLRLAMVLALHLGRREGDLIQLTWGDYDGTYIAVTNRKGGKKRKFQAKVTDALKATLDAHKLSLKDERGNSRVPLPEERILTTVNGRPWTESHFSTKFSAAKNAAGLQKLHFHDLRGTAITGLAEQECTHAEIASISGHSQKHIEKILDTYMATTRNLNDKATAKMEKSWIASVIAIE